MKTHYERYRDDFLRYVPRDSRDGMSRLYDLTPLAFYARLFDEQDRLNGAGAGKGNSDDQR
ncbi:hypothetical protein FIU93_22855 [Labrenzia sp. THAF35]|nr:hypothetical protein FIU93_22855 [Labrenzia sp. THAF35]